MLTYLAFAATAVFFGAASILVIPRRVYRELFVYALLFGGAIDALTVVIFTPLHLIKYLNLGPFSVFGLFSYWTPLAWTFMFMLFFYFLPVKRILLYPYILSFACFGYMLGLVLSNYGVFRYLGHWLYAAPVFFAAWFSAAAWAYRKLCNSMQR